MEKEVEKYSTYEVHRMLEERAGEKISEYNLRTLMECWQISRGLPTEEMSGFTKAEADDFLNYAY